MSTDTDSPAVAGSRVFISYAHDDEVHENRVRDFWVFLRSNGLDAKLDLTAAEQRQEWPQWMSQEIRDADFVLVVASPAYKRRAEGLTEPDEGRGVQWEARNLRELVYADPVGALQRVLPVVLPEGNAGDVPSWLNPASATVYTVRDFTLPGAEKLIRLLTAQPYEVEPDLVAVPRLLPRGAAGAPAGTPFVAGPLRTEVVIDLTEQDGALASTVVIDGVEMSRRRESLPAEVASVWASLSSGPVVAASRMVEAGRRLAETVFDPPTARQVGQLASSLRAGDVLDVRVEAAGTALGLPVELLRLTDAGGVDIGPIALQSGVQVHRHLRGSARAGTPPLPGPLKLLVAVAAPDETKTDSQPLDVEAEMQAVLDATSPVAEAAAAQVKILEVASVDQIAAAVQADRYHVLHLSAHGSASSVELENEDGEPVQVGVGDLIDALRRGKAPVPLIVLSSCDGGSGGADGMAAGLIAHGADRVVARQTTVTDGYATQLAHAFYAELVANPDRSVSAALTNARIDVERQRRGAQAHQTPLPEYGVATLYCAAGDPPLIDISATAQPLTRPPVNPTGTSVRDLAVGQLIGRRRELRTCTQILRRSKGAVDRYGDLAGVVLTGTGGLGKTAIAGRVISRLRNDGWYVAVHEGRWSPAALIDSVATAIDAAEPATARRLRDQAADDTTRLDLIGELVGRLRLLLAFDDFEQNLDIGGGFQDAALQELLGRFCDEATVGGLLFTCRYPLPDGLLLERVPVPPLSPAELRRMFLRMPALRDLADEDRALIARTIGGHPRLIEFVDALLRGGRANLRTITGKLRDLARKSEVDLGRPRELGLALDDAVLLGSTDILLADLLDLLTPTQHALLLQASVSRAPFTIDDLAFALTGSEADQNLLRTVTVDAARLVDLTLLNGSDDDLLMHPWTADAITRTTVNLDEEHQRAHDMRLRRFGKGVGSYWDLLDLPRHLAHLARFDDLVDLAQQAIRLLPGSMATVAYLSEVRPLVPTTEHAFLLVADLELNAVLSTGDLAAGRRLAMDMLDKAERRADADPTNSRWQRDLSISHNQLGDLATAAGDLTEAGSRYTAAHAIREQLAAADPANTGWQRDLSVSQNKLGELAAAAGDLTEARTRFTAALAIAERLAAADPANTGWQRDLSVSHERLGEHAAAAGDLTEASSRYTAAHAIREQLAAADPANTGWQRDLSVSHESLGGLAIAAGDLTEARVQYTADLAIAERLAAADPTNTGWQRDLSISHEKLGDFAAAAGDLGEARTRYTAALAIAERLAAADPTNTGWQRDLSVSHIKLGDVAAAAGGPTEARTRFAAALTIVERLAAADPANTGWQRDLSVSHERLGELAGAASDLTEARSRYAAGLAIAERLAAADPTNTGWQRDLSISRKRLGELAAAAGDLIEARVHYTAALTIAEADPTNPGWQTEAAALRDKLNDLGERQAD
jgi:tetratricopeptide (TPR) repeat protein